MSSIFSKSRWFHRRAPGTSDDAGTRSRYLGALVEGVAIGDTRAFAALYDATFVPVWAGIASTGASTDTVSAVVAGTYIEVWHLSRDHLTQGNIEGWLVGIATKRLAERRSAAPSVSADSETADALAPSSSRMTEDHDQLMKSTVLDLLHRG